MTKRLNERAPLLLIAKLKIPIAACYSVLSRYTLQRGFSLVADLLVFANSMTSIYGISTPCLFW